MDRYTLLYLKWIANKDLLYRIGNFVQRRVWGRMDICICMAESLCCPPERHSIVN